MNKIYAIGDIHGCYDKLVTLMERIDIDYEEDLLIFMGDYIDRGKNSFEVVEYLIDLRERHPGTIFLKGNHEEMLEKYLSGEDRLTYLVNGGQQTLENYLQRRPKPDQDLFPESHIDFFKRLLLYFETDDYIFVHAGLRNKIPLEKQTSEDFLWIREKFIHSKYDFGKQVVFGHTPFPEPLMLPNKIGIDTGAVYGRKLTCVRLPDLAFYQA